MATVTALSLYGTNTVATTVSTANKFVTGTGGTGTTKTTLISTSTGYGQLYAQGNAGAWPALGAIGNPDGHGFLWDVTTLEGNSLVVGNYIPKITLATSTGTCTATIICRLYKYNAGTYTAIGSISLTAQSITTTATAKTLPTTQLEGMSFATGDKLYVDIWLQITGAGSSGATIALTEANSSTSGLANAVEIDTPGYLSTPSPGGFTWFDTGYAFKKPIVLDHTKVSGGSDLSSFPVLVSLTDADLKTTGNGGHITNASGYDIIFTDSTQTTQLSHEIESYTATTGTLVFWVNVPTLSASVDTTIWLYFSNSAISTFQSTASAVWDSHYMGVWHLADNAANTTVSDSTTNANTGTNATNTSTKTTAGQINGGMNYPASTDTTTIADSTSLNFGASQDFTVSVWVKSSQAAAANVWPSIVSKEDSTATPRQGYEFTLHDSNSSAIWFFDMYVGGTSYTATGTSDIANGSWHFLVGQRAGSTLVAYQDGSTSHTSTGVSTGDTSHSIPLIFGSRQDAGTFGAFTGTLDEVRISNTARSAGWISTEYANQSSPTTFEYGGATSTRPTLKDMSIRLRISAVSTRDIAARLRLRSLGQNKDVGARLRLSIKSNRDVSARLRLALLKDVSTRLRVRATTTQDVAVRMRVAAQAIISTRDLAVRLVVRAFKQTDVATRLRIVSLNFSRNLSIRFPFSAIKTRDLAVRLVVRAFKLTDVQTRLKLASLFKQGDGRLRMLVSVALSLYGTNVASTTLGSANRFATTIGGTAATTTNTIPGGVTGYGEITSQGGNSTFTGSGTTAPTGHGWMYDSTALEGQQVLAGNWIEKVTLASSVSFTASLIARWYKYNGAYTPLGTSTLTGQTLTAGGSGTTPLTVYGTNSASSTLPTANNLVILTGTAGVGEQTTVSTSSGYGELYSQGTTGAWPALGSIGSPSGHGFLWDVTTLEGQQFIAGNWTPTLLLATSITGTTGNLTATIIVRAYKYNGGTYTAIGSVTLAAQALSSAITTYNLPATAFSAMSFGSGDKLYMDVWLNITTHATGTGNRVNMYVGGNGTQGQTGDAQLATPGYQSSGTLFTFPSVPIASTNFYTGDKLYMDLWANVTAAPASNATLSCSVSSSSTQGVAGYAELDTPGYILQIGAAKLSDILIRLKLVGQRSWDLSTRLKLSATPTKDAPFRLIVSATRQNDVSSRLRVASLVQNKNVANRMLLSSRQTLDTGTRLRLASGPKAVDVATRYRLFVLRQRDVSSRLNVSVLSLRDTETRLRLRAVSLRDLASRLKMSATKNADVAARLNMQVLVIKNIAARFRLLQTRNMDIGIRQKISAQMVRDVSGRVRVQVTMQKDLASRLRFSAVKTADVPARLKLQVTNWRDLETRLRLSSLAQTKDTQTRLRLQATPLLFLGTRFNLSGLIQNKDVAARLRMLALKTVNVQTRMGLGSLAQVRDVAQRLKVAATRQTDVASRLRVNSLPQLKDMSARFRLSITRIRDVATRLSVRATRLSDCASRMKISASRITDTATRLRLSAGRARDMAARLPLASANKVQDVTQRFKLSGLQIKDVRGRFLLSVRRTLDNAVRYRVQVTKQADVINRLRMRATGTRDIATRFIVLTVNGRQQDALVRYRLVAISVRDGAMRLRVALLKDVSARLRLQATQPRDMQARYRILATKAPDIAQRLRFASLPKQADVATRYKQSVMRIWDTSTRLRLAALKTADVRQRFKLASVSKLVDVPLRLRLNQTRLLDVASRLTLQATKSPDLRLRFGMLTVTVRIPDLPMRFALFITMRRDLASRFHLRSPQFIDIGGRFKLATPVKTRDIGCRFNLALLPRNAIMQVRHGDITLQVRKGDIVMEVLEN